MKRERNLLQAIPKGKMEEAYKKALIVADNHIKDANVVVKENKNYGSATTHLITSTEENIKALLLFFQWYGLNLKSIKGMKLYFTDHIIKHQTATLISSMYPFLSLIHSSMLKLKDSLHNPEKEISFSPPELAFITGNEKRLKSVFKDLPEMFDWFDEAMKQRNKGSYVDYYDDLDTPLDVKEEEYIQALSISKNFQIQIQSIIEYLNNLPPDQKKNMVKLAKERGVSNLFSKLIESRKLEIEHEKNNKNGLEDLLKLHNAKQEIHNRK